MKKYIILPIITVFAFALGMISQNLPFDSQNNNFIIEVEKSKAVSPASDSVIEDYYGSVWTSSSTGNVLRQELESRVRSKMGSNVSSSYSSLKVNSGILANAYEDPNNSNNKLLYYDNTSVAKSNGSGQNKEHVWPDSRGSGKSGPAGDPWLVAPADSGTNSGRGNAPFGETTRTNAFDPGVNNDYYRGIAARAILYGATVYWHHPARTDSGNTTLELNDEIPSSKSAPASVICGKMGYLTDLLKWNIQYPVTEQEILRNEYLFGVRQSRNPFVDKPSFGCSIWGEFSDSTRAVCQSAPVVAVTSVNIQSDDISIEEETTKTLTVEVLPINASDKSLIWSSSDDNVIEVKNDGRIKGLAIGDVVLTVKSRSNPTISDNIKINVRKKGTPIPTKVNVPLILGLSISGALLALIGCGVIAFFFIRKKRNTPSK